MKTIFDKDTVAFPHDLNLVCKCGCRLTRKDRDILTCWTEGCEHFGQEFKMPMVTLERLNPNFAFMQREMQRYSKPMEPDIEVVPTVPAKPLENKQPLAYLRQTGRTMHMLYKARELIAAGTPVTIVVADHQALLNMHALIRSHLPGHCLVDIQIRNAKQHGPINLETLRVPGIAGTVLFDHWMLEERAATLLKELHAYDPPDITVSPDWRKVPLTDYWQKEAQA